MNRRVACVLPLFSVRRAKDYGIGDTTGLVETALYLKAAGIDAIQVLPPHALPDGETSPYGAETAFAIDPMFIDLAEVPELAGTPEHEWLPAGGESVLLTLRHEARCEYARVRPLKRHALGVAYARFCALPAADPRRTQFSAFCTREHYWLSEYASYASTRAYRHDGLRASDEHIRYEQFVIDGQWRAMRDQLGKIGVELWGDVPFIVGRESADVVAHPEEFRHVSLGAPPDPFAADGQDWGLPAYAMERMQAGDFAFLKARTHRAASLYNAFRIDHVIGYFRQWVWTTHDDGRKVGGFDIEGDDAQRKRGWDVLSAMKSALDGSSMFAEDLGMIPPFVREVLAELSLAGYKIVPWENSPRVQDPRTYPENSIAAFGTHDTDSILGFWDSMEGWIRDQIAELAGIRPEDDERAIWSKLLALLATAGSNLRMILAPDLFGSRERINVPGTVGPHNWSYRFPKACEALREDESAYWHHRAMATIFGESGAS